MKAENLAIVFSPTIIVPKNIDPASFVSINKEAIAILTFIIEWAYDIFDFNKFEQLFEENVDPVESVVDYEEMLEGIGVNALPTVEEPPIPDAAVTTIGRKRFVQATIPTRSPRVTRGGEEDEG